MPFFVSRSIGRALMYTHRVREARLEQIIVADTDAAHYVGKVAALYVQHFEDSQAVAAVNDVEQLTSGLARKIWQKIMILHAVCGPALM